MDRLTVALVTTHPIQYQVPWFRAMASQPDLAVTVLFGHLPTAEQQGVGFGVAFQWDLPLLEGYEYLELDNVSTAPALSTFKGCDTPAVGRVLDGLRAQAVIANGWHVKTYIQTLIACRRRGVPCLVRGESNALRPRRPWTRLAHRLLLSQYSAFLAIGKANREFYLRNGVPEGKLFSAPYCVDNDFFAARASAARNQRDALRSAWGLPTGTFVALFAGKLVDKKRPLDVIRAAALARSGGPPLHVIFAGEGPLRESCQVLMRELGVPGVILGFLNQTQMPEAYAVADALVLPSDHGETWGLVVNEAMACGLPVAVSDHVGCHPDLVQPGRTGELFRLGDVRGLASILAAWARDPASAVAQGARARELVRDYSVAELVRGTRQALQHVTRGR